MSDRPTVLLLGGTGRTGLCALEQLTQRGVRVRAIVRDGQKIPPHLREHASVQLIEASLLSLSAEELESHVRGADAVASCLGHVLSVRGIFGAPRDLVQIVVVTLAIEVEQGVPGRDAAVAMLGQGRPDHGVALVVRDIGCGHGGSGPFAHENPARAIRRRGSVRVVG